MVAEPEAAAEGFDAALDVVLAAFESGLDGVDDEALVGVMRRFERVRNRMALVDHELVGACERRDLPARHSEPNVARLMASVLRVSPAEANRRVRAAEACRPRMSLTGEPLAPVRPALAAAQRTGEVSGEQADLIVRA